jgi:fatty-acyl-CoA synthase
MGTSPLQSLTLGQILDRTIAAYPDNDAVVYFDRDYRLTYREFGELVDRIAKGLMALGVQKGEKVALWATNVPHWVALMFATARIGAIFLTINTLYKAAELEYVLGQSDAENLFIIDGFRDTDYVRTVYDLVPELKTHQRGYLKSEKFPHLKRVFFLGHEKHRGMYSVFETISLGAMVSDDAYRARQAELDPHDVINMQYTSGTTGFPKGVMLTHYNIGNNGYWIGANQALGPKDRICLPVPLFHCFGCVLGVMAAINHGSTLVILEYFDPVQVMAAIEGERCTAVYGVPTMFIAQLQHKLFSKFDFSSLRTGIMAGSPCPVKTMEEVMEKMYLKEITICYGLTEASPVMAQTTVTDSVRKKVETVGKPMPEIEVAIMDPETHKPLPQGVEGEVCCRGYSVMKGYYKMPEATAKTILENGWLLSGDLGILDEDGYLKITGRHKDMIIRGGENISPREIEEYIYRLDGIQDVQVVGVPSRKYGEQVAAFVILKEGFDLSPEDVQDFCRGKISNYKVPKYVSIIEHLPLTASGKVQKFKLREIAAELWPDA